MKVSGEDKSIDNSEPAFGELEFERRRTWRIRRTGAFAVVFFMMAVAFAGLVQAPGLPFLDLSENIAFFDDFEDSGSGGFDWDVWEEPPGQFGPSSGMNSEGQFDLDGSWSVHMNSPEGPGGIAAGFSPPHMLEPDTDYTITLDLMVMSPASTPYLGWFTVVDDGNVWLIIDGEYDSEHISLISYSKKGLTLPPFEPLEYGKWYYIECRVHVNESEYDVYVNGAYKGTGGFDRGSTSVLHGHIIVGDISDEVDAFGEAYWDNILVSKLVAFPWSDEIGPDMNDWTTIVSPGNYFGPWPGDTLGRSGFVLAMTNLVSTPPYIEQARGLTPYYDQPRDKSYILSFWFMVQYPINSEFKVVDDGRIWLEIADGGTDLQVYVDELDVRYVDTLTPGVWYYINCRIDVQTSTYGLYLDDTYDDAYDFSQFEEEYLVRPMAPKNLFLGAKNDDISGGAEAYWDDFKLETDSDGDGLSDWEELNGYRGTYYHGYITDPYDQDTDDDGLMDSIEVGLNPYDSDPSTTTDPTDDDSDDDGLMDGTEDANHDGFLEPGDWNEGAGPGETDPLNPDTDFDRLTDGLEVGLETPEGTDTASPPWGTKIDLGYGPDFQPLTTTDPLDADTDNDGIPDGWIDFNFNVAKDKLEFEDRDLDGERDGNPTYDSDSDWNDGDGPGETDPLSVDTDDDGLSDYDEIDVSSGYLTDPLASDTDGDGLLDGLELGVAEWDMKPSTTTDPLDKDTDDDGIYDGTEDVDGDGRVSRGETDPNLRDTDDDKLTDGQELGLAYPEGYSSYNDWQNDPSSDTADGLDGFAADADSGATETDPLDFDTDDDGLPDGMRDFNANLQWDFGEFEDRNLDGLVQVSGDYGNYPGASETDPNLHDTDNDGATDYNEIMIQVPSTNPIRGDTDEDDIPDGWEIEHGLNPLNSGDRNQHYDSDGVTNFGEYLQDTDPWDWDTDCDFLSDNPNVDPDPLMYNMKKSSDPKYVLEDVDVVVVTSLESMGRTIDVSVAIDYSTPSTILPEIYDASTGPYQIENGVLVGSVVKIFVRTDYHLDYTAVVKVKYRPEELPGGTEENDLLMYYHDGYVTLNGAPQLHWTLFLHENDYLHEDTSRDMQYNFVWAKTNHLGYFAVADTTMQSIDYDEDSDGEELNVADYDPTYDTLCDGQDNCFTIFELQFDGNEEKTVYAKIWLEDGSIEEIDPSDLPELRITGVNYYGVLQSMTESTICLDDDISSWTFFAQSFTTTSFVGGPYTMVEVQVMVQNLHAGGDLRIDFETDDDGEPSSDTLGHGVILHNSDQWPDPPNEVWVRAIISLSEALADFTKYWLVLSSLETDPQDGYLWNGDMSEGGGPYANGCGAKTTDGGVNWELNENFDHGFKVSLAGFPEDPWLNVLKVPGGDPDINWDYNGLFDSSELATDFVDDFNDHLSLFQSTCVNGVCAPYEGFVYVPFEFHSDTKGRLEIRDIHITTYAAGDVGAAFFVDSDNDGLSDAVETLLGTFTDNPDSDGDGLSDGEEVLRWGTIPIGQDCMDSDQDEINDGLEVSDYHTDPNDDDTDGDGIKDNLDYDPLTDLSISMTISEIHQIDKADGIGNPESLGDLYVCVRISSGSYSDYRCTDIPLEVNERHLYPSWGETYNVPDDNRNVDVEIELWDWEPSWGDTKMDISIDGDTVDIVFDLKTGQWSGEDSSSGDDRNGYGHVSGDEDGSIDEEDNDGELWFFMVINDYDEDNVPFWDEVDNHGTNPAQRDDDGDGMPTWWEHMYGLDYADPSDAQIDSDSDHLNNVAEYNIGSDPAFFEINLWVSFEWDVDNGYMNKFIRGLRGASDYLYDMTDGNLYFRAIMLNDNEGAWGVSDIHVYEGCVENNGQQGWPRASVGAFDKRPGDPGWNWDLDIELPEWYDWMDVPLGCFGSAPDQFNYFTAIAHEFGHYGMYLYDEYKDADKRDYPGQEGPHNVMAYPKSYSELTTPNDYASWSPPPGYETTRHWHKTSQSCWEEFFDHYENRVWFDLDNDGFRDNIFRSNYEALEGPSGTWVETGARYLIIRGSW